jgi:hypothetical protein
MDDLRIDRTERITKTQFSLARLFFSMTAIACGLGGFVLLFRAFHSNDFNFPFGMLVALLSGAATGAGLLAPFRRPVLGAFLGMLPIVLLIALFFWLLSQPHIVG